MAAFKYEWLRIKKIYFHNRMWYCKKDDEYCYNAAFSFSNCTLTFQIGDVASVVFLHKTIMTEAFDSGP